ncbi:galactosyldiacylglycerol synthase [Micromonospora sonneratiae]
MDERQRAIVVISAAVGAGHDGAARELARRLQRQGFRVDHLDVLDAFPWRMGRLISGVYHGLLTRAPWSYAALFAITNRSRNTTPVAQRLLSPLRRRLRRLLPPETHAVVSTYPFASQVLGSLREQGELDVPVIAYLTDFSVHPLCVAPGVDMYCAAHPETAVRARALGAQDVRVVAPLVSDRFRPATAGTKRQARQKFGLPEEGRIALLVAGSWGVGDVETTATEVARTRAAIPVVVCGRNAALHRRLSRRVRHVFGWVDDMPTLMRAVDVVVENAGGLTCLEALASGLPVATYRPIPGHGTANAAIMAGAQVASWIRRSDVLESALIRLMNEGPQDRSMAGPRGRTDLDAATVVAATALATKPLRDADQVRHESRVRRLAAVASVLVSTMHARPATPPNRARTDNGNGNPEG